MFDAIDRGSVQVIVTSCQRDWGSNGSEHRPLRGNGTDFRCTAAEGIDECVRLASYLSILTNGLCMLEKPNFRGGSYVNTTYYPFFKGQRLENQNVNASRQWHIHCDTRNSAPRNWRAVTPPRRSPPLPSRINYMDFEGLGLRGLRLWPSIHLH